MTEIERIADQLRRAHEGDAWHGPAVAEILKGVSAAGAAARLFPDRHSLWEILGHITAWERIVRRRLEERSGVDPTAAENFPKISDFSEEAWRKAVLDAEEAYRALHAAILKLDDAALDATVPEHAYSLYVMLHGAVQHTLYHAGQIALLKGGKSRA